MIIMKKISAVDGAERNYFYSDQKLKIRDKRDGNIYRDCVTPTNVDISFFEETDEFSEEVFEEVC